MIVIHELVHARRDQISDLGNIIAVHSNTLDQLNVVKYMSEGEAHYISTRALMHDGGSQLLPHDQWSIDDALGHGFSGEALELPYEAGGAFVNRVWCSGGWPAIEAMWLNVPASTEQMLHELKINDMPQVLIKGPAYLDWLAEREVASTTLGEHQIFATLYSIGVPANDARLAASGWDGDVLSLIRRDSEGTVLFWRSMWDREADAVQFEGKLSGYAGGNCRRVGHFVDWVSGEPSLLNGELFRRWSEPTRYWTPDPRDAETALAVEDVLVEQVLDRPFANQGYGADPALVFPSIGVSVDIPEGWSCFEFEGDWMLAKRDSEDEFFRLQGKVEPPLPPLAADVLLERLSKRMAVYCDTEAGVEGARWIRLGRQRAVVASTTGSNGQKRRLMATACVDGVFLLSLWFGKSSEGAANVAWDAVLSGVRVGKEVPLQNWHPSFCSFMPQIRMSSPDPPFSFDGR